MVRKSMDRRLKIHKQKHLLWGAPLAMCGRRGNIPNHSSWERVTCKNCLKTKKETN
jgi:hypothetical protein